MRSAKQICLNPSVVWSWSKTGWLWKRDTLAAFTEGRVMNFGHAFQSVLPKPQLIQFSPGCYSKGTCTAPGYCVTAHPPQLPVVSFLCTSCMHASMLCVESHFYVSDGNHAYAREYLLHVNPCVHMHLCVRVDTLSGGFHIAQQKGSVMLCALNHIKGAF